MLANRAASALKADVTAQLLPASPPDVASNPSPGDAFVIVDGVYKSFPNASGLRNLLDRKRQRRFTLRDVNLVVKRGELLGLLGPNGAGKTTLLKMLSTLLLPDAGRILVNGIDVIRQPIAAKRCIGVSTAEERSFYFRLSAIDNLRFFGTLVGLHGAALTRRIEEVAAVVSLSKELHKRFESFSSGMRQRLTVARALLADPDLLIFDEPTRAVDPVNAEDIRQLIRTELVTRCGKTVIYATNIIEEAWAICDRVAVINGGTIVAVDAPAKLSAGLRTSAEYRLTLGHLPASLTETLRRLPGVSRIDVESRAGDGVDLIVELHGTVLEDVLRTIAASSTRLRDVRYVEPRPYDVFRHVTETIRP